MSLTLEATEPLVIDAEVARWTADDGSGATLAVAFRDLDVQQEDLIQDALLKALEALNDPMSGVRGPIVEGQNVIAFRRPKPSR